MYRQDKEQVTTDNLFLAASLVAAGFQLRNLGGLPPHKAQFVFTRNASLAKTVEAYWNDTLKLPARSVLQAQKSLKDRLWQEGRMRL